MRLIVDINIQNCIATRQESKISERIYIISDNTNSQSSNLNSAMEMIEAYNIKHNSPPELAGGTSPAGDGVGAVERDRKKG